MARGRAARRKRKKLKTDLERRLCAYWQARIQAGLDARQPYEDLARTVSEFMRPSHRELFTGDGPFAESFPGLEDVVSVPAAAQVKAALTPRLALLNPTRTVSTTSSDPVMLGLARLLQTYLNHVAREADLADQVNRASDDALQRGKGVLRLCWDEVRKIVVSKYVSSLDLVFDPDATRVEEAQWIAIRHREPYWKVARRLKEEGHEGRLKGLHESSAKASLARAEVERARSSDDERTPETTTLRVEWWEVLSKFGRGIRGLEPADDLPLDSLEGYAAAGLDEEDFVCLGVAFDHPKFLHEGDWDVPLYDDDDWPITTLQFVDSPDQPWTEGPFGQVIPNAVAADAANSRALGGALHRGRVIFLCDASQSKDAQEAFKRGEQAVFVPIRLKDGQPLDSVAQIVQLGASPPELAYERAFHLAQIEKVTGTTSYVSGTREEGPIDRSAAATNARADAASTRVGDMQARVRKLLRKASRKEALAVRLFLDESDVAPFVKASDLGLSYLSVQGPAGELPVRGKGKPGKPTLQSIEPSVATYFRTDEEAVQGLIVFLQTLQAAVDPETIALREALGGVMLGPDGAPLQIPEGVRIEAVDVRRVWRDTAGISKEEIMRETSYEVGVGGGIEFNSEASRQSADALLQTVLPVVAGTGDYANLNKLLRMRDEAYEVPEDKRFVLSAPPAPPPRASPKPSGKEE